MTINLYLTAALFAAIDPGNQGESYNHTVSNSIVTIAVVGLVGGFLAITVMIILVCIRMRCARETYYHPTRQAEHQSLAYKTSLTEVSNSY